MSKNTIVKAYCIMGTIAKKIGGVTVSPQFPTFYLLPDVNGCSSEESAAELARQMLNSDKDPNVTVNATATLVTLMPNAEPTPKYKLEFFRSGKTEVMRSNRKAELVNKARQGMRHSLPDCSATIVDVTTDEVVWEAAGSMDGITVHTE